MKRRAAGGPVDVAAEACFNTIAILSQDWRHFHRPGAILPLARYGSLLLLERPADPVVTAITRPRRLWEGLTGGGRVKPLAPGVYSARPFLLINDILSLKVPGGMRFNRRPLRRMLSKWKENCKAPDGPTVLWIYHPLQLNWIGTLDEDLVVYECYDDHSAAKKLSARMKLLIDRSERLLAQRAHLIIATSKTLADKMRPLNPSVHLMPNGVDYAFFSRAAEPDITLDSRVVRLSRPVIGYLGTIHQETDLALLDWLAGRNPHWSLVLVGPLQLKPSQAEWAPYRRLSSRPNVHNLGWVEFEELIPICAAFDVGVIPYREDSLFNRAVFPNKLHEYLAMGKPVVATALPELLPFASHIVLAESPEAFEVAIRSAIESDGPELIEKRMRLAYEYRWERRAEAIADLIGDALRRREFLFAPKDNIVSKGG